MKNSRGDKMAGSAKLKQLKSSWTPLSNEEANHKIFEERRDLVSKWFDKWSDSQRKQVLDDLVARCRVKQLVYADSIIAKKKPVFHLDMTTLFPRVISIYIFSFLDPRSLCRCAQVSWNWRTIVELDQLWMPKAIRRGWILPFSPSPYEHGTWKRLYVENASSLKYLRQPKWEPDPVRSEYLYSARSAVEDLPDTVRSQMERLQLQTRKNGTPRSRPGSARGSKLPPWKGSDPTPKDTWRNNYLENDDEVSKVNKLRKKGVYGPEVTVMQQRVKNKVNTGTHVIKRPSSVPRSKSALALHDIGAGERPDWAMPRTQDSVDVTKASVDTTTVTISRPAPVKAAPSPASKTVTIQPSQLEDEEMFQDQPWHIPQDGNDSDT